MLAVPPAKVRVSTDCSACSGLEMRMTTSPVGVPLLPVAVTVNLSHVLCVVQFGVVPQTGALLVAGSTMVSVTVLVLVPRGA